MTTVTLSLLAHLFLTLLAYNLFKIHLLGSLPKNIVFAALCLLTLLWDFCREQVKPHNNNNNNNNNNNCISNSHPISLPLFHAMCRHDHFDLLLPCECVLSRKTTMAKSRSFSSVASDIWNKLSCHLSSISALPAFKKRPKHHLFLSTFPGISSPSTDITSDNKYPAA